MSHVDHETYGYDLAGNQTSMEDNDSNVTSSTYDGDDRLSVQTVENSGSTVLESETWKYDGNSNVTDLIDVIGSQTRETRYTYDGAGRLIDETDGYGSMTLSGTITYDLDDDGNLLFETDAAGNVTAFKYNAEGEVTWSDNAMSATSTFQFDPAGNMTSELDADGRLQTFTYDAFGRETGDVQFTGSTTFTPIADSIAFGYDANGNMTLASNNYGTYTMQYDPLGRLTFVSEPVGVDLTFGYDGDGNRTLEKDSLGGTVSSVYDTADELTTEIYTQSGGYGMKIVQEYDWQGRVTEQEDYNDPSGTPTLVASSEYGYNAEGSVTSLDESTTASMVADYTLGYDAAQELTQSIDHSTTTNFAYDVLGELTTYGTTTQSYSNEGNRSGTTTTSGNEVSFDGTYSYGYDPEGNETSMWDSSVSWSYTYDDDNHMTSAKEYTTAGLVMEANYSYNAFGNLVEEDVSTGSGLTTVTGTKYVIDSWNPAKDGAIGLSGSDVIADLRASDGSLETRYVWGDNVGQLFGRYDAGPTLTADPAGTYFTMTDQNGSVRDIVDSAGSDVDTITYDAFGKALTGIGSYSGHYTFDGYDYDAAATKFYLNNARVYDPASGRWLSQDPEGFAAGDSNLYRYVNNAPTNAADPSGMQPGPGMGARNPDFSKPNISLSDLPDNGGFRAKVGWTYTPESQRPTILRAIDNAGIMIRKAQFSLEKLWPEITKRENTAPPNVPKATPGATFTFINANPNKYECFINKVLAKLDDPDTTIPIWSTDWKGTKEENGKYNGTMAYITFIGAYINVTPWFFNRLDVTAKGAGDFLLDAKGAKVVQSPVEQANTMEHELGRFYLNFASGSDLTGTTKDVYKWDDVIRYLSNQYDLIEKIFPPKKK